MKVTAEYVSVAVVLSYNNIFYLGCLLSLKSEYVYLIQSAETC